MLPEELARTLEGVANGTYITPVLLAEATVYEFLRRGSFGDNLERVRRMLGERRDAMLEALESELDGRAVWSRPEGGYFLWIDLPVATDDVFDAAAAAGVTFVKGADFFPPGGGGDRSARLAFSFVSPDEIREGVARLAALVPAGEAVSLG